MGKATSPRRWYTYGADQVAQQLTVNPAIGLDDAEIAKRQAQYGKNELVEQATKSPLAILWEQLTAPLVLILIFAAVVSAFLGELKNVIAIMIIVILNAILGVVQEYRAEKAMQALKKMAAPAVRVRRNGRVVDIPSADLVPGDIILLEAGNIVPADGRLVESANLRIQEASLTGESLPVDKNMDTIAAGDNAVPIGDRHNMVYLGTAVTYGRGAAVVTDIGMATELGKIATMIQSVGGEKTPLQRRMAELGKVLLAASVVIVILAFTIGLLRGEEPAEMFLIAVAMAVAVVPEGLPAVVTISLALGAQRMLKRKALIRKLPAVETLGSVTYICSDKTGTLTENRMTVRILDVAGRTLDVTEVVRAGRTPILNKRDTQEFTVREMQPAEKIETLLLVGGALCNDAILEVEPEQPEEMSIIGDPTEGALLVAAGRYGLFKSQLDADFPRVAEVPFSSERKRMTTIHSMNGTPSDAIQVTLPSLLNGKQHPYTSFTKGSVDGLLEISNHVWDEGRILPMTPEWKQRIEKANNELAQGGLRVLGIAYRPMDELPATVNESVENNLIFVGMVGMIDPARREVKDAVRVAKEAGIRPVMITGDHPLTAQAIAHELAISDNGKVLTGTDLAKMTPAELEKVVEEVQVYARVSPENKLAIVGALQNRGHIVAMTGDGVNDAPALRKADIGVAMGITGTAVSKEASDMVILDDNFATIVSAVEEGRTIYDNVRKFVKYILASNTGEVTTLLATQAIGLPLPLSTLQILWMNLITDGVPALALGIEKSEPDAMKRPPYAPNENIFGRGMGRHILLVGTLMATVTIGLGAWAWTNGNAAWNTMMFMTMTLMQMGHALAVRSNKQSLFKIGIRSNPALLWAVIITILLQFVAIYVPLFQELFGTEPLTIGELALSLALSTVVFWGVELEKLLIRRGILK
ncbi:MAG: ATPase [Chloroflexota bacterium]|nr:MAG: ATPase [Chloroflexota bacterium]